MKYGKRRVLLVSFLIVSGGIIGLFLKKSASSAVHYHAGFLVYVDGERQDFSDIRFMHVAPCGDDRQEHKEDAQLEKAHLHDNIGDVVHVHKEGALWKDLFVNIRYFFPLDKDIVGYINGNFVPDVLSSPIVAYDSVVIIVGEEKSVELNQHVEKGHIEEVERKSENCGTGV